MMLDTKGSRHENYIDAASVTVRLEDGSTKRLSDYLAELKGGTATQAPSVDSE